MLMVFSQYSTIAKLGYSFLMDSTIWALLQNRKLRRFNLPKYWWIVTLLHGLVFFLSVNSCNSYKTFFLFRKFSIFNVNFEKKKLALQIGKIDQVNNRIESKTRKGYTSYFIIFLDG